MDILKLEFLGIFIDWVPVQALIVAIVAIVRICTFQSYIAFTFLVQFIYSTVLVFLLSYVFLCFFIILVHMTHWIGLWSVIMLIPGHTCLILAHTHSLIVHSICFWLTDVCVDFICIFVYSQIIIAYLL